MLWTEEEIKILKEHTSLETLCELLPFRTRGAISRKRSSLNKNKIVGWTEDERRWLAANYTSTSSEDLQHKFPTRTLAAIRSQVSYLRKRKWTIE